MHEAALTGDSPELALAGLLDAARAEGPRGTEVMLILPDEQIRYDCIASPAGGPKDELDAVNAALEGATPYAIDELVVDWHRDGSDIHIAAVARETLDEAESFLSAQGFAPVGFTAMPPHSLFPTAPFFGPATSWTGTPPARLTQPVQLTDAPAAEAQAAPSPEHGNASEAQSAAVPGRQSAPAPEAGSAPVPETENTSVPEAQAMPRAQAGSAHEPLIEIVPAIEEVEPDSAPASEVPNRSVPQTDQGEAPAPRPETTAKAPASSTGPQSVLGKDDKPSAGTARPAAPGASDRSDSTEAQADLPLAPLRTGPTVTADEVTQQDPQTGQDEATAKGDAAKAAVAGAASAPIASKLPIGPAPEAEPAPLPGPEDRVSFTRGIFGPGGNARADTPPAADVATPTALDKPSGPSGQPATAGESKLAADRSHLSRSASASSSGIPAHASTKAAPVVSATTPAPRPSGKAENLRASRSQPEASGTGSQISTETPTAKAPPVASPQRAEADPSAGIAAALSHAGSLRKPASLADEPPATKDAAHPSGRKGNDRSLAALFARRKSQAARPSASTVEKSAAATRAAQERERLTVFGARNAPVGGKPRFLGLTMTVVLIALIAAVAAWASVFLDEGISGLFDRVDPPVAEVAVEQIPEDSPSAAAVTEPDAPVEDVAAQSPPEPAAPAPSTADTSTPALNTPDLSPEELAARYAATGIWQQAPAAPRQLSGSTLDDLYVASVDPTVEQFDPIALPPMAGAHDLGVEPVRLPPGPDVRFDLDDRGLVRASPEGTVSPDGVRIFSGPPPQVPPARTPSEDDAATTEDTGPAETDAANAEPPADEARPNARPEDLVEQSERVTLRGNSIAELALLRPVLRPESVQGQAAATENDIELPEETDVAQGETIETAEPEAAEAEPAVPSGTAQAVAQSVAPQLRPGDMARRVERAEVQTASAAPRQPALRIPQNANVAQQATVSNQLNLRQMNLIGVFGTDGARRALVRMSNGRLQNVKVGDRLDGGRVAAIGDTQLQLVKSGRSIVLRMPSG
ncbi:hypothetical protein [Salipiger pallidus]|uniref:hypothetical protein n=1 Tax=Salipiger pallidus TaxID=1775170 RepID=UPI001669C27E|nr:hypothetical protein [Salipiger pallidus]